MHIHPEDDSFVVIVSDHNTDYIMLYSVQLENMYSYLNGSLRLSGVVRGLSCQQSYCNLFS